MAATQTENNLLPFFVGTADRQLFACYHAPTPANSSRDCTVIICPPIGQEYIRAHRALFHLASRLAGSGFPTLRFDLFGCGDSAGDLTDASILHWKNDVNLIIEYARRNIATTHVCLAGLRFGATIALLVSLDRQDIARLVLWEAVIDGHSYIEQLRHRHQQRLKLFPAKMGSLKSKARPNEMLGFALPSALQSEIEKLQFSSSIAKAAPKLLWLSSDANDEDKAELFGQAGNVVTIPEAHDRPVWFADANKVRVPYHSVKSITSWLVRE